MFSLFEFLSFPFLSSGFFLLLLLLHSLSFQFLLFPLLFPLAELSYLLSPFISYAPVFAFPFFPSSCYLSYALFTPSFPLPCSPIPSKPSHSPSFPVPFSLPQGREVLKENLVSCAAYHRFFLHFPNPGTMLLYRTRSQRRMARAPPEETLKERLVLSWYKQNSRAKWSCCCCCYFCCGCSRRDLLKRKG